MRYRILDNGIWNNRILDNGIWNNRILDNRIWDNRIWDNKKESVYIKTLSFLNMN